MAVGVICAARKWTSWLQGRVARDMDVKVTRTCKEALTSCLIEYCTNQRNFFFQEAPVCEHMVEPRLLCRNVDPVGCVDERRADACTFFPH